MYMSCVTHQNMKTLLLLTFMALVSANAQPQGPTNQWPTVAGPYPGGSGAAQYCAYRVVTTSEGLPTWVKAPGVAVNLAITDLVASGYHTHEVFGPARPVPSVSEDSQQDTDSSGCATWHFRLPAFAGWYTVVATPSPGFPAKGYNSRAYFYTQDSTGIHPLEAYEDNTYYNRAQIAHADPDHEDANGHSVTYYMTHNTAVAVRNASYSYKLWTIAWSKTVDFMDIARASLPDGGAMDNLGPGYSPDGWKFYPWVAWETEPAELHAVGTEIDVVNPGYISYDHAEHMIAALFGYGCRLGALTPEGFQLYRGKTNYWLTKDIMHFSCGHSPIAAM